LRNLLKSELALPIVLNAFQCTSPFHRDPIDQLIVATARVHDIPLLTCRAQNFGLSLQTIKP
jgi:PIN domain nuclease of toxin-antitoxin system